MVEADLVQPFFEFVTTTEYVPITVTAKLATLPGLVTPAGTVQAYDAVPPPKLPTVAVRV